MFATRREILELMILAGGSLGRSAAAREPSTDRPRPVVTPEYLRTLESVLVSIPADTISYGPFPAHDGLGRGALSKFLDIVFRELLEALPDYTHVHIAARSEARDFGLAALRRAGARRAQLHLVDEPDVAIELWAQDLGEPIVREGRDLFLVAKRMSPAMGPQSKMSVDRKRVAEFVFGEDAVVEAGFAFEGGNLAFDAQDGATRVLVGYNTVSRTVRAHAVAGRALSRREVLADISTTFGGAEVIEMGKETQRPLLQHIDQAFLILHDGVAVACRVPDGHPGEEVRQLRFYADQLRDLGYRVVFLDHGAADLEQTRSSINCVPFVDKSTGERKILFPVFPGEVDDRAKGTEREFLKGKAARAFDLYRELGYQPRALRDVTHPFAGNTHCVLNALT